jgi:hypothetical protein
MSINLQVFGSNLATGFSQTPAGSGFSCLGKPCLKPDEKFFETETFSNDIN